jgi:serine/threonine protein kinase
MIGQVIEGEYEIEGLIGNGTYGVVYRCKDRHLGRTVAVKMMNRTTTEDRDMRRFFSESRNLASLNHPNIIQIYRLGEFNDAPYIVMEYLTGQTLREVFRDALPPLSRSLEILRQAANGLGAMHDQGILHRDLSTNNIMLTDAGGVKILDLGLSKDARVPPSLYSQNSLAGTITFIAPEIANGEPASYASDIFSFGVVLYEAVTGRNPFHAEHVMAMLYNTVNRPPEPIESILPGAPEELSRLVSACLEKDPGDRPRNIHEIETTLAGIMGRLGGTASAVTGNTQVPPKPRPRLANPYLNRTMLKKTEDFFGRTQETHRIFARLNATPPGSISLVGDRRIGKSSLLNHVYAQSVRQTYLQHPDRLVMVFLDFQQEKNMSLEAFVRALLGMAALELRGRLDVSDCSPDLDGIRGLVQRLDKAGFRLVLLLDEFDGITTNSCFSLEFFSFLRYLANHYNVAYLTSSSRDLQDLCHTREISDSPFFNIFSTLRLGLFRPEEATELIAAPSRRVGRPLAPFQRQLMEMAGLFPFFLQIACSQTLEYLEENPSATQPDFDKIGRRFFEEARFHYRYIWDGLDSVEKSTLLRLAKGKEIPAALQHVQDQLARRNYILEENGRQRLFASAFADFIRLEGDGSGETKRSLFSRWTRRKAA